MSKATNNEKKKNLIIIILSTLLICALGIIYYDKVLTKQKIINNKCPKCEKCTVEKEEQKNDKNEEKEEKKEKEICELDMKNENELDVYHLCEEKGIYNASRVKIKNISIDKEEYILFHDFIPFYDAKDTYVNYNGITKLYLNGILLDVYKGQNRETLWKIKIEGDNLIISETWPSEAPPVDYTYDLKEFNYNKHHTYDLSNLM